MGDIRQDFDEYYGTCCIEYCHACQNCRPGLEPCERCNFLFCPEHRRHDCARKEK
jgi:hypothetical protein